MERLIIIVLVLALLSALVGATASTSANKGKGKGRQRRKQSVKPSPSTPQPANANQYVRTDGLLSPAELNFYRVVARVLAHPDDPAGPPQATVMSKVSVSDLVQVRKGLSQSERSAAFNRIRAKHADFVLCDPVTMQPLCVIELDDKSHQRKDREARDTLMDSIYAAAGIPILHVKCRRAYHPEEIARRIRAAIQSPPTTPHKVGGEPRRPRTES
ncbi:MAG: DUF2726 domain-containing protein [bacterium]|nr:DUF2726 domain-containing protein [bacterium]